MHCYQKTIIKMDNHTAECIEACAKRGIKARHEIIGGRVILHLSKNHHRATLEVDPRLLPEGVASAAVTEINWAIAGF